MNYLFLLSLLKNNNTTLNELMAENKLKSYEKYLPVCINNHTSTYYLTSKHATRIVSIP